jgi:hypothetical protein
MSFYWSLLRDFILKIYRRIRGQVKIFIHNQNTCTCIYFARFRFLSNRHNTIRCDIYDCHKEKRFIEGKKA